MEFESQKQSNPTVEELAKEELFQEARRGYFGDYSRTMLRELKKPYDEMSQHAQYVLNQRVSIIASLEGKA